MSVDPKVKRGNFKGWSMISTGGNCHALYLDSRTEGRYWMATDREGLMFPPRGARIALLCECDAADGYALRCAEVPTSRVQGIVNGIEEGIEWDVY